MRRKVLQDVANTLCHMLVGWRMGEDREVLSELPDGVLTFDVLLGTAEHNVAGAASLCVAGEMAAWLKHRQRVAAYSCYRVGFSDGQGGFQNGSYQDRQEAHRIV